MHELLLYDALPEYLARRGQYRDPTWAAIGCGELLQGGALGDPADGALLILEADSPAVAEPLQCPTPTCGTA